MPDDALTRISAAVQNPEFVYANANGVVRSQRFGPRWTKADLASYSMRLTAAVEISELVAPNRSQNSAM